MKKSTKSQLVIDYNKLGFPPTILHTTSVSHYCILKMIYPVLDKVSSLRHIKNGLFLENEKNKNFLL